LDRLKCPYRCLTTCNIAEARYCIAQALASAYQGDMDKGLVFCGQNAYRVNKIVTVKELIAELRAEIEAF
jgi:NAD(P)H-dependent flavin oxidoreductase YrpB (nitropropane dioxygenase family)